MTDLASFLSAGQRVLTLAAGLSATTVSAAEARTGVPLVEAASDGAFDVVVARSTANLACVSAAPLTVQ